MLRWRPLARDGDVVESVEAVAIRDVGGGVVVVRRRHGWWQGLSIESTCI
jgi:hypothetical protein